MHARIILSVLTIMMLSITASTAEAVLPCYRPSASRPPQEDRRVKQIEITVEDLQEMDEALARIWLEPSFIHKCLRVSSQSKFGLTKHIPSLVPRMIPNSWRVRSECKTFLKLWNRVWYSNMLEHITPFRTYGGII